MIAFKLMAANDCQMLERLYETLDAITALKENFVELSYMILRWTTMKQMNPNRIHHI